MVATRTKLKVGDRIAIRGEVERFSEKDGRQQITVVFPNSPAPITLDAMWANTDKLKISDRVRLEGRLERINNASDPRWTTGSLKIDGFAYASRCRSTTWKRYDAHAMPRGNSADERTPLIDHGGQGVVYLDRTIGLLEK